jgi:hypothetical protein
MKKLTILLAISFCYCYTSAQTNYAGTYGYQLANESHPKDKNAIPGGTLVLVKMEDNKYRFWLDVLNGAPGWNRGETDGTITFTGDSALFDNTFEDATNPCILKFKMGKNTININSQSTSFNCGFGNGVHADGDYPKLKVQPVTDNKWLNDQYHESPVVTITSKKALLYHDENCRMEKEGSFVKGISLLNIQETENTFYTEYINPQGKFMYGWVKKINIK